MKKILLLSAFLVGTTWAFAGVQIERNKGAMPENKPENREETCVVCQECNGLNYCVRAPNCLIASAYLILILFEEKCFDGSEPTTT